jgi:hypothetical protein
MRATTTAPDCERPAYWHDAARLGRGWRRAAPYSTVLRGA